MFNDSDAIVGTSWKQCNRLKRKTSNIFQSTTKWTSKTNAKTRDLAQYKEPMLLKLQIARGASRN